MGGCAFTANGEATILSLIRTTPENDVLALLDYVRSNSDDPQLLRTLISKINYSDLVNALTYVVKSSPAASAFYDKTIPSSEQSLEEHLIVLNKGGIFGTDYIGKEVYDFSYENKKVKVSKRTITGFSQAPAGAPSPTVPVPTYSSPVSYELDPYELVVVVNHSRLSALQGELGVGNGEAVLLPAIALDYVAQQQMQATLLETVNLATIPIGGGQLSAALRAGKSAVALFEAAAIIGAVGQSALDANILPVAYQTQFGALFNSYNTIIGLTGLGIVGGQGLPRLGTWVQRAANSLDSYKIGRSAAQTFLDQLTALKQLQNGQVWQQMLQANRQRLEALAAYLVTKGMKAGEVAVEGIMKARTLADLVKQAKVATLAGFFYVSTSFTGGLLQQAAHLSPQAVEIGLQTLNQTDEVLFEATNFANISTSQSRLGSISGLIGQGLPESIERVTLKMAPTAADIQSGTNLQTLAQSQTLRITRAETESLDLVELASLAGVVLLARPKDNQNTDCSICKGIIISGQNRNDVCNSLEALAAKAGLTYKGIIENRLCKANITNLKLAELAGNLQTLNTAYLQRLLTDINESTQLQNNLNGINKPLLTTWQYLFEKHTSRAEFARKDWNTLQQFGKLNDNVKEYIVKFSDANVTSSSLIKFCVDLPKPLETGSTVQFLDYVNDANNFNVVRKMVSHKLMAEEFEEVGEEYQIETSLVGLAKTWVDRSDKLVELKQNGEDGRFYGKRAVVALLNNSLNLGITGIDQSQYKVFNEVQLWVDKAKDQYMIADILLVKYNALGQIDDVIICESKLSAGTDYTKRQKQGWRLIYEGKALEVKAVAFTKTIQMPNPPVLGEDRNISIPATTLLNISTSKCKRIADAGSKDGGFTVSNILVSNYSTYQAKN